MLSVTVVKGANLPNVESFGAKIDPICTVIFQGRKQKTKVISDTENPTWNENFEWDLAGQPLQPNEDLEVVVKDYEKIGSNKLIGKARVPLQDLIRSKGKSQTVTLQDANGRDTKGKVELNLKYTPPPGAGGDGDTVVGGFEDEETPVPDEGGEIEGEAVAGEGTGVVSGTGKRRAAGRPTGQKKRARDLLPNKPQDFEVRVKVWEGRQLQGGNIHPLCKVMVSGQGKTTRVKNSTNNPFWEEIFFFNFNANPNDLFDDVITLQVFNSKRFRSDALIGSFTFDIGMVYDSDRHAMLNKWLLLTSQDETSAGVKGYLKISAAVVGTGDDVPTFKKSEQSENDDIESNLLRPAGVTLRKATITTKLYHAEDIPQMDPGYFEGIKKVLGVNDEPKELVDPYFILNFAGKKVKSKIVYNNDHPEYNQELKLGVRFPSMCEKIKYIMKDWDRLSTDDTVGTFTLDLSAISSPGDDEGFLPTFGPCFINFYGSTREFSDLPDQFDDLNMGKGEGVSYRGRALVSIESKIGEYPETTLEDIHPHDVMPIQKYLRRRRFRLYAGFTSSTMVSTVDAPVEYEVSIGNYGNKFDPGITPDSSYTQPTNAVFDGCNYYFLPWGDNKPCIIVNSQWEDIAFRLNPLNVLLRMIDRLDSNIQRISNNIKAAAPTPEIATQIIALLDLLIEDCRAPMPQIDPTVHKTTVLDQRRQEMRMRELSRIIEEATRLREDATDVVETLTEIESYLNSLRALAVEPQNSMPDIVIWMISGSKRVAYHRIPAYEVLYNRNEAYSGRHCGKIQSVLLKYPNTKYEDALGAETLPAMLRLKVWLGLEQDEEEWQKMQKETGGGTMSIFAETYENQINVLGRWITTGMPRPKFSDVTGDIELSKEDFTPPTGWTFDGDWYISPEQSLAYDADSGHKQYVQDIFEHEVRLPAANWMVPPKVPYTDVKGDACPSKDEADCPEGWAWLDDWQVDLNRAVDEEGWEYSVEASMSGWGPVTRSYHLCRRRRWVRGRTLKVDPSKLRDKKKKEMKTGEGWEYAPLFNMKFHHVERTMDLVRKRRWHRRMVAEGPSAPPAAFVLPQKKGKKDKKHQPIYAPRIFLCFKKSYKYQLRAYMYQARGLIASDSDSFSDPYAYVCFSTRSERTEVIKHTLCPTWDQTLIVDDIELYGEPQQVQDDCPDAVIELFDLDTFGSDEFLGRVLVKPIVKTDCNDTRVPKLAWHTLKKGNREAGELLASFELYLKGDSDLPFVPPMRGDIYQVPSGIRPVMQRTAVEVLSWGVRNMKRFQLASVTSPAVEFEIGGHILETKPIKNTKVCPNFSDPLMFFNVMLPKEELYMPPMNIKVRDHRAFGRKPIVGIKVISSLQKYWHNPLSQEEVAKEDPAAPGENGGIGDESGDLAASEEHLSIEMADEEAAEAEDQVLDLPQIPAAKEKELADPMAGAIQTRKGSKQVQDTLEEIDWWSKYYASTGDLERSGDYLDKGYDTVLVLNHELEKEFDNFNDFSDSFCLNRGKGKGDEEEDPTVGEFKGTFRIYQLDPDPQVPLPPKIMQHLPSSDPEVCVVRVYVVRAFDLKPQDPSGLSDPYLKVKLGKNKISDQDSYIPNTLNPVFGRLFELRTSIPVHKDLTISVMDYDQLSADDIIGETVIDLENRFLTKHRATCGLPATYNTSGHNTWRDTMTPKQILEDYAKSNSYRQPRYLSNSRLRFRGKVYDLAQLETEHIHHEHQGPPDQRLALYTLRQQALVKEHIETRPIYSPVIPGIDQGKLQLWIDIFPESVGPPGSPIDIAPRKPKKYYLKVIIWNTSDVKLDETSLMGEQMSDIYVKGWLAGTDEKLSTDIHYRSLDGEGNFNWRFVFPFEYIPAEECMVIRKKEHFWSLDEREDRLPPTLMIQIWDNDHFSPDDFLGQLELNLNRMISPKKRSSSCNVDMVPDSSGNVAPKDMVSIFEQKRKKGWWPCITEEGAERELTGKVEMEIELLTEEEFEQRPSGCAREEPNMHPRLEEPVRPATSFNWLTSPWKSLKYIIWGNYKWYIIGFIVLVVIVLFIALLLYTIPGALTNSIFN